MPSIGQGDSTIKRVRNGGATMPSMGRSRLRLASVMARLALEHALPPGWVDEVFETHRRRRSDKVNHT